MFLESFLLVYAFSFSYTIFFSAFMLLIIYNMLQYVIILLISIQEMQRVQFYRLYTLPMLYYLIQRSDAYVRS